MATGTSSEGAGDIEMRSPKGVAYTIVDKDGSKDKGVATGKKPNNSGNGSPSIPHDEKLARSFWQDLTFESIFGVEWPKMRKRVYAFMDLPYTQLFLVSLLLLSLYITDCWVLGNEPDSSTALLDGILTTVFVIFIFEVVVLTLVEPNYYLSFFFFMDVLGTLSIILDIQYMSESFLPSGTQATGSILRATRTAKLGARYGRLMRILKLIKFIQYIPCMAKKDADEAEPTASSLRRVTYELSNMISQRVAALVMIIVIVVPFLSYSTDDFSPVAWLQNMKTIVKDKAGCFADPAKQEQYLEDEIADFHHFYKYKDTKVVEVSVETPTATHVQTWETRDVLRSSNVLKFNVEYSSNSSPEPRREIYALMDYTTPLQFDAACGVILVTMVIFILVSFSASFQTEVEVLVVAPLEKMLTTLRSSATVMLKSMNAIEKETAGDDRQADDDSDDGEMETLMLEKMVDKLTRIIKLTYPGANDLNVGDGVDSKTANWLHETYSTNKKKRGDDFFNFQEEEETAVVEDHDPMFAVEERRLRVLKTKFGETRDYVDTLSNWHYDTLQHDRNELIETLHYLYEVLNIFEDFHVPDSVFYAFCGAVATGYCENEYHNFRHGVDVCYTVYRLLIDSRIHLVFTQLEMFSIVTAALAHDIGHPGVNNVYLVKSKDPYALMYNDHSPLENMHCAMLYEVLQKNETNIFMSLNEDQWRESRKIILTAILGTDMSNHFEQISKTQLFLEVNKDDIHGFLAGDKNDVDAFAEDKERHFVLEVCLHCADVSNPYKPFGMYEQWAKLITEEFGQQGDREKENGLEISPMCDRHNVNLSSMQYSFIQYVVSPLIIAVISLFYPLHEIGDNILYNYLEWSRRRKTEIAADKSMSPADQELELDKIDTQMDAFTEKFEFLAELKTKPVRTDRSRAKMFLNHKGGLAKTQGGDPHSHTGDSPNRNSRKILGKQP